jgi:hypothetical protein
MAGSTIAPDPTLTPGAVRTTDVAAICSAGTRAAPLREAQSAIAGGWTESLRALHPLNRLAPPATWTPSRRRGPAPAEVSARAT